MAPASARGAALADVVLATALVALVSATTLPVVADRLERERAVVGAQYLRALMHRAQIDALRRGTSVALRFRVDEDDTEVQAFQDGNGTGVLLADIERGIDPSLGPADWLGIHARDVSLRLNQTVPDIDGAGSLEAGSNPLRIGRTTLLSFSPAGSATSGTVYLASRLGPQFALRVTGSTGRVRVLRFDQGAGAWRP